MSAITNLARHWMGSTERGRGVRLDAEQLALLNAIGVGELLAIEAAKSQREQCLKKTMRSIGADNTGSNGTESATDHSEAPSSRLSGMTPPQAAIEAAARARAMCKPPKRRSTGATPDGFHTTPACKEAAA